MTNREQEIAERLAKATPGDLEASPTGDLAYLLVRVAKMEAAEKEIALRNAAVAYAVADAVAHEYALTMRAETPYPKRLEARYAASAKLAELIEAALQYGRSTFAREALEDKSS